MFEPGLVARAAALIDHCRARSIRIATAESCTGGLVAGLLTDLPGSSDVFERGFVTYSNAAKAACLGIDEALLVRFGAVSRETAIAMAKGARSRSEAGLAIAVTGIAGPGGGSDEKPVGLVHLAAAATGRRTLHVEMRFGDIGRGEVRLASVSAAVDLLAAQAFGG